MENNLLFDRAERIQTMSNCAATHSCLVRFVDEQKDPSHVIMLHRFSALRMSRISTSYTWHMFNLRNRHTKQNERTSPFDIAWKLESRSKSEGRNRPPLPGLKPHMREIVIIDVPFHWHTRFRGRIDSWSDLSLQDFYWSCAEMI